MSGRENKGAWELETDTGPPYSADAGRILICQNLNMRTKEVAQSVKCWPCRHEDLSVDPQHPYSKLGTRVGACKSTGEVETFEFLALAGISQASQTTELQVQLETPCQIIISIIISNNMWRIIIIIERRVPRSLYMYICTYAHTHEHVCAHAYSTTTHVQHPPYTHTHTLECDRNIVLLWCLLPVVNHPHCSNVFILF